MKSMTGYGGAKGSSGKLEISVELKSVNNRHLDCTVKMPRMFMAFEEPLKSAVQRHVSRGKVDVYVTVDTSQADDVDIVVNRPLAQAYITALRDLAREHTLLSDIRATDLTRFPDILQARKREADPEQLCADICAIMEDALCVFNEMRVREGEKLRNDIETRLCEIERLTDMAELVSPRTVAEYRKKLETRMKEVLQNNEIDEQRILTEAALFADRVAMNEELVRLRSHIGQLREMLPSREPIGRKMDFLVQEFNREANTIGSKGNDAEMSRIVIDLKAEIEKIREQAQNIE